MFKLVFPSINCSVALYSIVIGPTILDKNGNLLNQDGDDVKNGEPLDDRTSSPPSSKWWMRLCGWISANSTTPVAAGYQRLTETDVYVPSVGYGWQDGSMMSYDRKTGSDLLRDFHYVRQGTFLVDVPNDA